LRGYRFTPSKATSESSGTWSIGSSRGGGPSTRVARRAVFFDTGTATPEGQPLKISEFKTDIGAGLRIAISRASTNSVIRVDAAYALNPDPSAGAAGSSPSRADSPSNVAQRQPGICPFGAPACGSAGCGPDRRPDPGNRFAPA
jgi:hypothetical protein